MILVDAPGHARHWGVAELINGQLQPCVETPARAYLVRDALVAGGAGEFVGPDDHGRGCLERVHTPEFVKFLESAWARWSALGRHFDALPMTWPTRRERAAPMPAAIDGALGYYSIDAATPITVGTWKAAYEAAQAAVTAAHRVADGAPAAFALCRPPGHHAGADYFGGYCYLNNAAIAAQWLRDHGAPRVAILDVDYHHGNGTQDVFYTRGDVLFVSIHADPSEEYPFYWGHARERGQGKGNGATLNLPLAIGSGWPEYAPALDEAARTIRAFRPATLVVSLGMDTYGGDPISRFRLVRDDYVRLGGRLRDLALPTVLVFEGGYATAAIGDNVLQVLKGYER